MSSCNEITVTISSETEAQPVYRPATVSPVQMLATDGIVDIALAAPGACSILGAANRVPGKPYTFTDADGGASPDTPYTYTPAGGALINGQPTLEFTTPYDSWTVYADANGNEHVKS